MPSSSRKSTGVLTSNTTEYSGPGRPTRLAFSASACVATRPGSTIREGL
ncbi:hypothetical protein JI435_416550 [Parastagonospora nodorum SN15]|uniref:Uncharacterized protein n=1 Tax=Phaeosphaeria nodorum (strain SN15 / ATCC MYA-4574 / FGSC 10173) TaxID=321614 RepID=A0A7U2FBX4_PHANO|nr:hypothetical protein JI435_416550 [Parastagonospora nodorum SN15]